MSIRTIIAALTHIHQNYHHFTVAQKRLITTACKQNGIRRVIFLLILKHHGEPMTNEEIQEKYNYNIAHSAISLMAAEEYITMTRRIRERGLNPLNVHQLSPTGIELTDAIIGALPNALTRVTELNPAHKKTA